MSNLIDEINAASLRDDIPAFRPGEGAVVMRRRPEPGVGLGRRR